MASVRMKVKKLAERWQSVSRALKKEDKPAADELVDKAKKHSNEVFYNFDDPLEAAVFSILLEMQKEINEIKEWEGDAGDSGLLPYWQKDSGLDEEREGWQSKEEGV